MSTYPDFVKDGGAYDIPKDQYNEMIKLLDALKKHPSQMSTSDYELAKKIDAFIKESGLKIGKDIKPSVVDYKQAQINAADETINLEKSNIRKTDEKRRIRVFEDSKPTLTEGAKTAGISAVIDAGAGTKGCIRGGAIYSLTNFTATPANVASAYVTAAFGIAAQIKTLEKGRISKEKFIINCETVCLDVAISAIASLAGHVLIPIPVLGAVIGNVAGEFAYNLCKQQGSAYSQRIISKYNEEMQTLEQELTAKYTQVILDIKNEIEKFTDLEKLAFDEDVNIAFEGSIKLAREIGVSENRLLNNLSSIDNYFIA